jgi:hypothetical protein
MACSWVTGEEAGLPMKRGARFSWRRARLGAVFAAPAEQAGGQFR